MSYLKKPGLLRQQQKLKNLIEERLKNEKSEIRQRVYQWLYDNQYFVDNELFDFYFCVAQNIAAVEILGGSGEKIVTAKIELDRSAQVFQTQLLAGSNQMIQQLEIQLADIRKKQDDLEWKLAEVLESLTKEQQNLQIISTGLVNSTTVLLKKQQQMLVHTELARKFARHSVIFAWVIPVMTLLGWLAVLLFFDN